MTAVSAVITTRNSARTLRALVDSLRAQTYPVEVVIVDNHSSDGTADLAEALADVHVTAGPERSAQRNIGVERAAGSWVLILDSDMTIEPQSVAELVATARDANADAVVVPEQTIGPGLLARIRALERSCYEGDETVEAARFFKKDTFLAAGGYDESLHAGEDWDLPARIKSSGGVIARADCARILHDETGATLVGHLRKKYYYGQSLPDYIARHRELAGRQFTPVRPAFVRHWRTLAGRPLLGAGVFALKVAEAAAAGAGMLVARSRKP